MENPHNYAYVWQGNDGATRGTRDSSDDDSEYYHSHGHGTFNINPVPAQGSTDPASGFYIGEKSLKTRLEEIDTTGQIGGKANKVSNPTDGNLVALASDGDIKDSGITKSTMETLVGYERTWQDSMGYANQASGIQGLVFKPRAFDMPDGAFLKSITLVNSRTVSTNAEVFIKLTSLDGQSEYAVSDSKSMTTKNTEYTFTFNGKRGLERDTSYKMTFYRASDGSAISVSLNIDTTGDSPDLYIQRTDYRPKAIVKWGMDGAYNKPTNGVPRSDLDEGVRASLDKADGSASKEDTTLVETYGDIMDSTWAMNPSSFSGYDLTLNFTKVEDVVKVDLFAGGASATGGNPITIQGDEETLTWYPSGSGEIPTWLGTETVVATRTGKYLVLGDQTDKPIAPYVAGGIPKSDLASDVQASLDKANSAVQPETGKGLFSGDYNDLTNPPTLGSASEKNVPTSGDASTEQVVMGNDTRLLGAVQKSHLGDSQYDFSSNREILRALTDCVSALGGTPFNVKDNRYWGLHFVANTIGASVSLVSVGTPPSVQLKYSIDWGNTWSEYTIGTEIAMTNVGDGVCFTAVDGVTNRNFANNASNYYHFVVTGRVGAYGDISSLVKDDEDAWMIPLSSARFFQMLFMDCANLIHAPELPSMYLTNTNTYLGMFRGCTSLAVAPTLPEVGTNNYQFNTMFQGCTSLKRIEVNWHTWPSGTQATLEWVKDVSPSGVFVCPVSLGTESTILRDIDHCPVGWTVVNTGISYIEANGTQYLDSGLVAKPSTKVMAKFRWTANPTSDNILVGARNNDIANSRFIMIMTNSIKARQIGSGPQWSSSGTYSINVDCIQEVEFKGSENTVKLNGSQFLSNMYSTSDLGKNLFIFANNELVDSQTGLPMAANFANARLYWMKIWQDGVLVRDYVPAVSNGQAGLYDKVNKTTIFNLGEGTFTYG